MAKNSQKRGSMSTPDIAILGLGYLGLPLAERAYQSGAQVAAVKRHLTSDDINLPIELNTLNLDQATFQEDFWHTSWANKPTWVCLLPPSSLQNYTQTVQHWLHLAETLNAQHLILASSISVYGRTGHCDEHTPPAPQTPSAKKILAAENSLQQSTIKNIDILRLGGLYSATRHPLTSLLQHSIVSDGLAPVNMIHQQAAVAALYHAICTPQGRRLRNIVAPAHPSKHNFYSQEAHKLGLPTPKFDINTPSLGKIVTTQYNDFLPHITHAV